MATIEHQRRMNYSQFCNWLDKRLLQSPFDSYAQIYPNIWTAYERAKALVKRELCAFLSDPDWESYDYYQTMIVKHLGV